MANGLINWFTVGWTICSGIMFLIGLILTISSIKKGYWAEKGTPKSVWCLVFITAMIYLLAVMSSFLTFIFILSHGWSSDNNHVLPQSTFFTFTFFYLIALYLNLYVWIQRLQTTFANSAYGYSSRFIKTLKIVFYLTIIVGFLTLILFIMNEPETDTLTMIVLLSTVLFILLFIGEIFALLYSFIYKLVQLRKIAEGRFKANIEDIDPASLGTIKKLLYLQLKLTVLSSTQILSTLIVLSLAIVAESYEGNAVQCVDVFIGYICIYCTIKSHDRVFKTMCKLCIICCGVCIKHEEISRTIDERIELHTQSQMGSSYLVADATKQSGSSGSQTGKHIPVKSTTLRTKTSQTEQTEQSQLSSTNIQASMAQNTRDSNLISASTPIVSRGHPSNNDTITITTANIDQDL